MGAPIRKNGACVLHGGHGFFHSHNGARIGASDGIGVARANMKEIEPIRRGNDIGRNRSVEASEFLEQIDTNVRSG